MVKKNLAANAGDTGDAVFWSLGQEDLLEEEIANHSSTLAWEIPWTKKPVRPSSPHRPPEGRGRARVLGPPPRPRDRRGQGRGGTRGPGRADPQAAGRTDRRRGSPAGPGRSRRRAGTARGASGEIAAAAQGTDARRAPRRRDVERVGPRWVGPRLPPGVGQ